MTKAEREKLREEAVHIKTAQSSSTVRANANIIALLDHIDALERALEEIANPIQFWKKNLEEGYDLDIPMAMHMADSPNTYQQIAQKALASAPEVK